MSQQTFYLNGGRMSLAGGKSRTYFQIDLPKNTIEWYYVFTTEEGSQPNADALNLVPQLTRLFDPSGITSLAVSAIITPTGSKSCDIYLMNRENADAFLAKVDNFGGNYQYLISGSRENFRNGTVQIKATTSSTYYLGFKNPSASTGITLTFEVAAIVEEIVIDNNFWSKENKESLFQSIYENIKTKKIDADVAQDLVNCLVTKIYNQKTPAELYAMIPSERNAFINSIYPSCIEKYKEQKTLDQEKAFSYGNLAWNFYQNGNLEKCIEYSKKAISLDNTLGWVKANLGLCFLIKGDDVIATDYYVDALNDIKKMKTKSSSKHFLKAAIDDINNALKKYQSLKGSDEIIELFKSELNNY